MADDVIPRARTGSDPTAAGHRIGRRLEVSGTVQGVGFRPFVYRLATELGIDGSVCNAGGHVVIDAAADERILAELARRLTGEAPTLARIRDVRLADLETLPVRGAGFRIDRSQRDGELATEVTPDIATCDDCLAELIDPTDRRYRYPFVNCTNCGPRATIIDDLPYDRGRTAMRSFVMCDDCRREYEDPADRRFHAEPIACPACGPALVWQGNRFSTPTVAGSALLAAENALQHGAIVAWKGLGGYQLVCDATRPEVVFRLRTLKHRERKPFAVMVPDLHAALEIAELDDVERGLLVSPQRPIVLARALRRDEHSRLAAGLHDGSDRVGIFLPNTPLHYLLMADLRRPMVVTSGNRSDEPMAIDDDDARAALADIADGFLLHNRPIRTRYDDSVVQVVDGRPRLLRRARGYAPEARSLPVPARTPLLAVGAELKHTFSLAQGNRAVVSPHIGDLENVEAYDAFTDTVGRLSRLVSIRPEMVVHDLHPAYLSTQFAHTWTADRRMAVQHHHAHLAACAAEYDITTPFIGVAYDGLGMGDDGTLWGGEILVADLEKYRRLGRFSLAPLPGGAAAVRRPARMALGYLFGAERFESSNTSAGMAAELRAAADDVLARIDERERALVQRMVEGSVNCPKASSVGRLFDAVAGLLGICDDATFEGEAAIALENVAFDGARGELPWTLRHTGDLWVYDVQPTLKGVVDSVRSEAAVGATAARFHQTIVSVTTEMCTMARKATGLRDVCLGGGVFQNRRLATALLSSLRAEGFAAYLGEQVPVGDGGISYGQAAIAAARSARR